MSKQQVNAGGVLKAEDIVGRDAFIRRAWRTLESQGLYITGERRMGKTSIIRDKMAIAPPKGYKLLYFDVANADSPHVFVDELFHKAKELASTGGKAKLVVLEVAQRLLPKLEVPNIVRLPEGLAPSWKEMLHAVLQDFANMDAKIVLAFDEMPLMLDKIKRSSGENMAMDVLDTLRKERQTNNQLRMIYTGSLGLHHVLNALQTANYQNAPLNDLKAVEVGPLLEEDARDLAWRLLNGMEISTGNPELLAQHLARITDGMAFYIQHLVSDLADSDGVCTTETADKFLTRRLSDLTDPWDLGYYKTRIDTHYPKEVQLVAFALLDYLSRAQAGQIFDDLLGGLNPQTTIVDEELAQHTLALLGKDHYIAQDEDGAYRFRYPLIARAWAYKRGLMGRSRR